MRASVVRELVSIVAMMALASTTIYSMRRAQSAQAWAASMEDGYKRNDVHDRLIGTHLDLAKLGLPVHGRGPNLESASTILWILDVDRCVGCFDSVASWMGIEAATTHPLYIMLIGKPTPGIEARLRVLERTTLVSVPRERAQAVLGPVLPNTKLLLDPGGIVLHADSRSSSQQCGWSFDAQVSALLDGRSALLIRDR